MIEDFIYSLQLNNIIFHMLAILASYLLGSISFGIIISRICGVQDIKKVGSGNTGATNVARSCGKFMGVLTLLLDAFKGVCCITVARSTIDFSDFFLMLLGCVVVLGHMFPLWYKFKGGKGIATIFGILMPLNQVMASVFAFVWFFVFMRTRISSLSSLSAVAMSMILCFLMMEIYSSIIYTLLVVIVFYRHKTNIRNIIKGKEKKI